MNIWLNDQVKDTVSKTQGNYDGFTASSSYAKQGTVERTTSGSAYTFQMTGSSQIGSSAYQDAAGKSASDAGAASAALSDAQNQENYRLIMSTTISDEEFGELMEEGYRPGEMQPEEIVTVVDEIKATMAQAGVVVAGYNDDLDASELEEITGSKVNAQQVLDSMDRQGAAVPDEEALSSLEEISGSRETAQIILDALSAADLPATAANGQEMARALSLAEEIDGLTDGSKKYLLENGLQPTLENLYLAAHSGASMPSSQARGYFSEGMGYLGKKPDEVDLEALQPQVDKIIGDAGFEPTEENRRSAGWMIENGLTLTEESFTQCVKLDQMVLPVSQEDAAEAAACAIKDGKKGTEAVPYDTKTCWQQAQELVWQVSAISKEAVDKVIAEEGELNIRSLCRAQLEIQPDSFLNGSEDASSQQQPGDERKSDAYAQLQEVRYRLTVASGARLLKSGIRIDTRELGQLVEDLKADSQKKNEVLFGQGSIEENDAKDELLTRSKEVVRSLPELPAALVGKICQRSSLTLNVAYEQGTECKSAYDEAGEKYETLMTAPRADLGDSIQEAFRSAKALLEEIGLDDTAENEKAVRILGYNQMEITSQSVNEVKKAYEKLSGVIRKMTPAATLDMIRQDVNPLETDLDDLEQFLNDRDSDPAQEMEKYSTFLVRMQEKKGMTEQEQESYIGIYRMLYQIEKKDSAALGAVLNQGGELTFKNLLSNVRSRHSQGKEFQVDDSFGLLEQTVVKGVSITEQISAAFGESGAAVKEEAEQMRSTARMTQEVENLLESSGAAMTVDEIAAAGGILNERGGMYRTAAGRAEDRKTEQLRDDLSSFEQAAEDWMDDFDEESARLQEAFTDRDSAVGAFEEMTGRMQQVLEGGIGGTASVSEMREAILAMKQIRFANKMAKQESYEVPMRLGDEITSVNVHLVHNAQQRPSVSIYAESESYGTFQASFAQTQDGLEGYVVGKDAAGLARLEGKLSGLGASLEEKGISLGHMNFIQSETFSVNYLSGSADVNNKGNRTAPESVMASLSGRGAQDSKAQADDQAKETESADRQERISTKMLYETAKAFLSLM